VADGWALHGWAGPPTAERAEAPVHTGRMPSRRRELWQDLPVLSDVDGVLFDLDDTLFDHRWAADRAAERWAQTLPGWTGTEIDAAARWLLLENEHFPKYARGECSLDDQRRLRVREFHPSLAALDDDAIDAAFANYLGWYESFWRPIAGAQSLIDGLLATSVKVGILTNGYPDQQRLKLERTGLFRSGMPIFASAGLGVAKPSPRAFELACAGLGTAPDRTVMVGDNYDFDVLGARRAGLAAVFFDRQGRGAELGSPNTLADLGRMLLG
jgi:putative hydrolase of the HAD superfamily